MKAQAIRRFLASRTGRLVAVIICFSVVVNVLIWLQIFTQLKADKKEVVDNAIQLNSNLAVSLEQYTIRTIRNADAVLQLVKKEYAESGPNIDFDALFNKGIIDIAYFSGVVLMSAEGKLIKSNLSISGQYNFSDRAYFKFHQRYRDSLHISQPILSRTIHRPVVVISRRLNNPDGSFAGIVAVQVEPSTFTRFYAKANIRRHDLFSLIAPNGITYARRKGNIESYGENISKSPLFKHVAKRPVGTYNAKDVIHFIPTYFSYRKLEQYPIIATVGSSEEDVLADYHERARRDYTFGISISLLLMLFSVFLVLTFSDRKKFVRTIKISEARYRSVFENSQDGIILVNESGEITAMNKAGFEMFGVDSSVIAKTADHLFISTQPKICFKPSELAQLSGDKTEVKFLRNDNSEFIGEIAHSGFRDSKQKANYIVLVRDISLRKQMQRRLMQEQKRYQRRLTKEIILAQEREREAIGYELHDNVNQILTTVKLFMEMATHHPDMRDQLLPQAIYHVQECIGEIRHLSHALSAPTLGTKSLVDSVKALVETVEASSRLRIRFQHENYTTPIPKDQKLALYRILQEQLNNVVKHAAATEVIIQLSQHGGTTVLTIKDDGKGFTPDDNQEGIGFTNMLSRAKVFNGEMKVQSSPGKGCMVYVSIPIVAAEEMGSKFSEKVNR